MSCGSDEQTIPISSPQLWSLVTAVQATLVTLLCGPGPQQSPPISHPELLRLKEAVNHTSAKLLLTEKSRIIYLGEKNLHALT